MLRAVVIGALALSVAAAVPAAATDGGGAAAGGACDAGSVWGLKAVVLDHGIGLTYAVHSDAPGQVWRVRIGHNGEQIFLGPRKTNEDGNFYVRLRTWNARGIDTFRARSVNTETGELCAGGLAL